MGYSGEFIAFSCHFKDDETDSIESSEPDDDIDDEEDWEVAGQETAVADVFLLMYEAEMAVYQRLQTW